MSDTNPAVPATPATPDQAPKLVGELPTNNFEEFLESHGKKTAAIIIASVLAVGLYYFFKSKAESSRVKEAEAFVSATTVDDLKAVAEKYAGKVAGGNALLILADRQLDLDKPAEAKATLEKFVAGHSDDPLYHNGVFALACVEEELGNLDAALSQFQKVADAGAAPSAAAALRAGDVLLQQGEFEKAKTVYEGLAPKFPSSPFIAAAEERVALAERKIILRDNPPPPPEPEPEPEPAVAPPGTADPIPLPGLTPEAIPEPTLPDAATEPAPAENPDPTPEAAPTPEAVPTPAGGEAPPSDDREESADAGTEGAAEAEAPTGAAVPE